MLDIYEKIIELKRENKDAVLVEVVSAIGMGPSDLGKQMLVVENGEHFGTVGGGYIEKYAIGVSLSLIKERKTMTERYVLNSDKERHENGVVYLPMACGGEVTLMYKFLGPKQNVYIFGAGHCGKALSRILVSLDFRVTVIDHRQELLDELDSEVKNRVCYDFEKYVLEGNIKPHSYVVVATPSHTYDYAVMNAIFKLGLDLDYFGMLCSKKKITEYLESLPKEIRKKKIPNLYSPIGLDIGGDSPEEIAISISGEILSVFYHKESSNSHLRNKVDTKNKYF